MRIGDVKTTRRLRGWQPMEITALFRGRYEIKETDPPKKSKAPPLFDKREVETA